MKMGANKDVTPESWVDYAAIAVGVCGVLVMGSWWLTSYAWACVIGKGDAWR